MVPEKEPKGLGFNTAGQGGGAGAGGRGGGGVGPRAEPASGAGTTKPTPKDLAFVFAGRGRLLRIAEVAEELGVCNATVYRLCETGDLPHVRVVKPTRIRPSDLAEYVAGGKRHEG